jgi:phosphotransferase system HPr (HPr) family protein
MESKSLIEIISEEDFLPLIQETCIEFFKTFNAFVISIENNAVINGKFYSILIQETEFLENFLDEHGARENKTWSLFTEYIASIRNLAIAAFYITHLRDRYSVYKLRDTEEDAKKFFDDGKKTLSFLNNSILKLYQESRKGAVENLLRIPDESVDPKEFSEIEVNKHLPRSASEELVKEEEERIIQIFEKMRSVYKLMREMKISHTSNIGTIKEIVLSKLDERKILMFKNMVHIAQSEFDTYIKNTLVEHKHESIKIFRGYISMPLHLMEIMYWLGHFYERHEDEIRQSDRKSKISTLVDKNELLECIVNFCFFYCLHYMQEGDKLSKEILTSLVKTVRFELPVPQPLGFHARPSTYISLIAREHDADVWVHIDGEKYNAKSVMSLLQVGGIIADKGYTKVVFEGDAKALEDIKILAQHNYCEDNKVPKSLSYLKEVLKST